MRKRSAYIALVAAIVPLSVVTDSGASLSPVHVRGVTPDVIPACRLPAGVTFRSDPNDMPVALRHAVKQRLGELVPPNSPFDATDVVMTGHNRRLIFIWSTGPRWVVATEHGGRGYNDPILAYDVSPDGRKATLITAHIASPSSVCSTAEELLNHPASPAPGQTK